MKIVQVRLHELVVPMRPGVVHSAGVEDRLCAPDPISGRELNFWEFPKWIVELVSDTGEIGLGEPRRGDLLGPLRQLGESMLGLSTSDLPVGDLPLARGDEYESYIAYEAYEMAWLDLLGRHLGVPVHHLLGGKRVDRVPIDFWMGRMSPEDTAERTRVALRMGFHGVKMKCKPGDPIRDRVAAIRSVAPTAGIVLDPNDSFANPAATFQLSRDLDGFDGVVLESPMPQDRLDWYSMVRGRIPQPIALHLRELRELQAALRVDAADYYNLIGPLRSFVDWARWTAFAGCPTWRGTGMDLGIRDASSVHAAAAAGCQLPSDIIGHILREDDLIVDGLGFEDGALTVPDRPGLGVDLDMDALDRYRVGPPVKIT